MPFEHLWANVKRNVIQYFFKPFCHELFAKEATCPLTAIALRMTVCEKEPMFKAVFVHGISF